MLRDSGLCKCTIDIDIDLLICMVCCGDSEKQMALERRRNAENQQRQMQSQAQQLLRRGLRRDEGTAAAARQFVCHSQGRPTAAQNVIKPIEVHTVMFCRDTRTKE